MVPAKACIGADRVVLHAGALARRVDVEGNALRDHAADIRRACGVDKVAGALDAQPRVARQAFLILRRARSEGEIGELMDDGLRRRGFDGGGKRFGIEHVDDDRLGTECAQRCGLVGRARRADNRMTSRFEKRRQPAADGAAGAGEKNPHANILAYKSGDSVRVIPRS